MDMRNVDFCNRSLVFNHRRSWGIQLSSFPSLRSFKPFSMGKCALFFDSSCAAAMKHHIHAEGVSECISGFLLYTVIYGHQHHV